ncbi:receptor-like protein EIX1 isoform X1 [Eucalyptus grandis]|uniref:receptor-like protein EIX1 isoform X1 n=1 Tax=Eucalyptus grandis TaxID=71139 RepID=UPI00192E97CD|nr:receptor-like protein EIX1 isoform X1 [Eucalyptus grandis]
MTSFVYSSFVPTLLCALFVIQALRFSHSKTLTNVSCLGIEREALLKLKQDLIDPSRRLKSWTGESCCKWEGVECSEKTGHVLKLDLHNPCDGLENCNLGGEIHPALNKLKYLKYLDLSFNNFTIQKTQESFTSLQKLEYFNLSFAGYGHISNQLSNLSNLRYLDLSGWIWSKPSLGTENLRWLSTFSYLKYLDLSYVPLLNPKGWLAPINMLSSLEFLILSGCELEDASASLLVNFTSLKFLDLSQNSMNSSIPPWYQNFSKLEHLDLSDNDLQGIFPTIILENSGWLKFLDVSTNRMEGELLKNLSSFCNLQVLSLRSNKFSGRIFNAQDGTLNCERSNLKTVDVNDNSFSGHLSNQFGNFKDLIFLDLSQNSISGPIPAAMGQLSSLRMLNLSFNNLSGKIPENIGLLSNLEVMDIGNNQFDGIVSQIHFANLTSLIVLKIYSTGLVINISASWVPPFQIQEILMSSCKVGPKFPNWLRTQKKVSALDMSNASISDEVPHWLSDVLLSIEQLDLSDNMLRGNISRIIGKKMPLLTQVSLFGNNLSGEIPNSLCMSDELSFLDLSKNQLSGRLPRCWRESQAFLEWISLGDNKLYGQLPRSLCHLKQLKVLGLHENGLDGVLPKCLLKLDLVILDLGDNQFTGKIPLFGNPKSFEIIDLGRNHLTGNIPLQLCHLANLQYLSLKHNHFSGGIPCCFNNFSRMWANSTLYFRSMGRFLTMVDTEGTSIEFTGTIPYLFSIDLSSNALDGQIPKGLMMLTRLQNLNLSQNKLVGEIPSDIGNLKDLQSLDLSNNKLSGEIPPSISNLDFLSHLDLSYNNLSGPIPLGNRLGTLDDQSIYRGNDGLCGHPLLKVCPGDELDVGRGDDHKLSEDKANEDGSIIVWFYSGMGPGFVVAFMGFCTILHFKKSWSISYFRVVDRIIEKLSIVKMITMLWFKRAFQFQLRK